MLRTRKTGQVGVIILIVDIFTPEHKRALKGLHVPIVLLGQQLAGYSCVYQDDYHAARAAEMLTGGGAEKVGCIGVTKRDRAMGDARKRGFLDVLGEAGIAWNEAYYEECGFSAQDGYEAARLLLELMNGTVPGKEVKMTYSVVERDTTRRKRGISENLKNPL